MAEPVVSKHQVQFIMRQKCE